MSIINKIQQSIEVATGLPFYYDTPQTLNERMSMGGWSFPCAMLHILQSNALQDTNGILRERLTIEVLFATTSSLDFDGTKVEEEELDIMKRHAFKWLLSLFRSHDLRLITLNGTNRYYATDDAIYSAYGVNITLEEIEGVSSCDFHAESTAESTAESAENSAESTAESAENSAEN